MPPANTLVREVDEIAFASIVQARPGPLFGRPVRQRGGPHRLRPGASPQTLRIRPHDRHPVLRLPLSRQSSNVGPSHGCLRRFQLRARLGFSLLALPGRRGITPAFGYDAPHPGVRGTSTLLTRALPSAHYGPVRLPVSVHHRRVSLDFPTRPAAPSAAGGHGISRFSREGRDRARARAPTGGGFPSPLFRLGGGFTVPPWPRFPRPPYDPGRSDFPSPVLTLAFLQGPSRMTARFKRWSAYAPAVSGFPQDSSQLRGHSILPAQSPDAPWDRQVPRAPLPFRGATSPGVASSATSKGVTPSSSLVRAHAPDQYPPTDSGLGLFRWVLAGCYQPLLGVGPSRHYLCESFPWCLDPYPGGFCGALTRFFPQSIGLPRETTGRLTASLRCATSKRACFRGCSHSFTFRPQVLLATQVAPTAVVSPRGSRGVDTRAEHMSLPSCASGLLVVRTGQLTTEDFHLLDSQPCRLLLFPCMHGVSDRAGPRCISRYRCTERGLPLLLTASAPRREHLSRLNTRPARTPVNASPLPSRATTHDSGPLWAANPSTYDSFIHNTSPVYPGAPGVESWELVRQRPLPRCLNVRRRRYSTCKPSRQCTGVRPVTYTA